MRYQEYNPPIELAAWVKTFWVFENRSNAPAVETVVSDGFPELIIHFRSPFGELDRVGQCLKQPLAIACGQLTRPLTLCSSRDAGMIGIRFHPGGMSPFLTTSMQSLTDARLPAEALFDGIDRLIEAVVNASNDAQRMAACSRFLLCSINHDREHLLVPHAVERIIKTRGGISVKSLASHMGVSRRCLESVFQREVGVSPKSYCRITRFRQLLDSITKMGSSVNWVQMALDSGFFDQPHMIRDFRQFTGASPISFLARQTSFAQTLNQVV